MWAIVTTAVAKVGGFFASAANAVLKYAAVIGAYFLGKRKAEREQASKAVEVKDEQLEAAARSPRRKSSIIRRMLDGDL